MAAFHFVLHLLLLAAWLGVFGVNTHKNESGASRESGTVERVREVFKAGEGGYFCFRIPALLFTSRGALLAFAEGRGRSTGSCSDHGDVRIVLKRSEDLGATWSNLTVVHSELGHTIGQPSLA